MAPLKDNVDVNDSFGKANKLSNQFNSVFTKEDLDNIPSLDPSPYPDAPPTVFTLPGITQVTEQCQSQES